LSTIYSNENPTGPGDTLEGGQMAQEFLTRASGLNAKKPTDVQK
jgi:hypothetical protein